MISGSCETVSGTHQSAFSAKSVGDVLCSARSTPCSCQPTLLVRTHSLASLVVSECYLPDYSHLGQSKHLERRSRWPQKAEMLGLGLTGGNASTKGRHPIESP